MIHLTERVRTEQTQRHPGQQAKKYDLASSNGHDNERILI